MTQIISQEQMLQDFQKFLEQHCDQRNGKLVYEMYYDYRDNLSAEMIHEAFEKNKNETNDAMQAINYYLWEEIPFFDERYYDNCHYLIETFLQEHPMYKLLDDELDINQELTEYYQDTVYFDENLEDLLEKSEPEDLTIYLGNNWDDDYSNEYIFQELLEAEEDDTLNQKLTDPETQSELGHSRLNWLLQTQGYSVNDLFDEHKRQKSAFLNDVYDMIGELNLVGYQVILQPNSQNWQAMFDLYRKQPVKVLEGTTGLLFNCTHGSGSLTEFELEKDIILPPKMVANFDIRYINQPYDYSPGAVYGEGNNYNWRKEEQLQSLNETELNNLIEKER